MSNKTNIKEDIIKRLKSLSNALRQNLTESFRLSRESREILANDLENILADRERLEKENEENRMSILMYRNLRKCFQDMVKEILGEDYYNMGMDTYTCDKLACEDIVNKKVKIIFKGKDKELQEKANKYDSLVENIKEIVNRLKISDIEPWSSYKVSGDILFDLQELLDTEKEDQC